MRTLVCSLLFAGLTTGAVSLAACDELRVADPQGDGGLDDAGDGGAVGDPDGAPPSRFTIVQQDPDGGSLSSVFGFAGNDVYAVGENGTMLHYDGAAWTKAGTTTGALLAKV